VIKFDLGRRNRRQALKADQAVVTRLWSTTVQLLESGLVERAHHAAWQVLADGLPRASMGEPGGGGGGHGDPTLGAVMANEQTSRMLSDLCAELERAESALMHAFRLSSSLASSVVAPAEAEPAGAGHCQRCDVWVSGSATDRIKSGYCERCYKAWRRAGNPDRSTFNAEADDPVDPGA
ncbi:MAG: hypothetical protein ACKO04_10740, partial [Actinomycetes bacterium]